MSAAVLAPPPSTNGNPLHQQHRLNAMAMADPSASAGASVQNGDSLAPASAQSPPSNPTKVRRQRPDTEEIRRVGRVHYQELFNFLRSHLAKEQTGPRSNAREKLTRLSKQQFSELSTDVYDELMRRINNARRDAAQPHLAVRDEFHPKRNQARQKLATLPKTRFKDLSSDVFFELERRFPHLKEEFRPEAVARERAEEERRLAAEREQAEQAERSDDVAPAPPANTSTSDVVIPAKSTLVQEDIAVPYKNTRAEGPDTEDEDDDLRSNTRDSVADNRSTMYSQASSMGTGFLNGYAGSRATAGSTASPNLDRGSSHAEGFPSVFGIEKLKADYEFRLASLQQRITALEAQNAELKEHTSRGDEQQQARLRELIAEKERVQEEHAREVRQLRQAHDAKHNELGETLDRLDEVQRDLEDLRVNGGGGGADYDRLQADYASQEQNLQDLRAEVESLVQEVQELSTRNEELVAEKDQDLVVIRDLNSQIQTFKRKYDQARAELRQFKTTSQLYIVSQPKADEFMPPSPSGVISDVNVTAFQTSIDELLSAARSTTPSNVLIAVKSVVLATTLVTDDIAKFEQAANAGAHLSADDADALLQLKPKISTTLNNLMTACRNHASSHGMSPVSLLDAAASHVSTTVVDLVKLLKVRSATRAEKDQFEAHFAGGAPPTGLKPLHIGVASVAAAAAAGGKSPTAFSPTLDNGEWKTRSSGERLNPIDTSAGRLSPRAVKTTGTAATTPTSATHGRYSPVGYRPVVARKDSVGSWKASNGAGDSSHPPSSSASSANGHAGGAAAGGYYGAVSGGQRTPSGTTPGMPTLPRTDLSAVKHQWSSPPRRRRASGGRVASGGSRRSSSSGGGRNPQTSYDRSVEQQPEQRPLDSPPAAAAHDSSEENWAELQNYIEVQTEAIVHCIQALLSAIREGAQGVQLNENLVQITTIASSIVAISRDNLPDHSRTEGEDILSQLTDNCDRLAEMQAASTFDKSAKSAMASASYGVAKGLKALNSLLNHEGSGSRGGDGDEDDGEGEIDLS